MPLWARLRREGKMTVRGGEAMAREVDGRPGVRSEMPRPILRGT